MQNVASLLRQISNLEKNRDEFNKFDMTDADAATLNLEIVLVTALLSNLQQQKKYLSTTLNDDEMKLVRQTSENMILVIKKFRERTGCGLLDAKNIVHDAYVEVGFGFRNADGYFNWLLDYQPKSYTQTSQV